MALTNLGRRFLDAGHAPTAPRLGVARRATGERRARDEVSIAREHLATAIARFALVHTHARARRAPSSGRRVLLACVEGEQRELGARVLADALDLAGHDVQFVGANTATLSLVERARPDLVALSASPTFHLPAPRAAVAALDTFFEGAA